MFMACQNYESAHTIQLIHNHVTAKYVGNNYVGNIWKIVVSLAVEFGHIDNEWKIHILNLHPEQSCWVAAIKSDHQYD